MSLNLPLLLEKSASLVKEVGAYIRTERLSFSQDSIEHKGLNNLVSYVDKTAEEQLVKGLSNICPDAGFETEEATIANTYSGLRWIIDPLDGTTNFMHGVPVFSISVALADNDDLLLGLVYEINTHELFTAYQKGGAFLNGKRISVTQNKVLGQSLLATGFPYTEFEQLDAYMDILKKFMKESHGVRRLGSAAVDLAYVACGRFDAFFEFNLNPWDVAAGALIVQEAGGSVTEFSGGEKYMKNRTIVASNTLLHPNMLEILNVFS
jgi:myo-inositol-1(or 4)-monophosphatase